MRHVALIDHHCHSVTIQDLERQQFEAMISESYRPPAAGTSFFDKPLGLAIRRHCAPILDLEPNCPADAYMARRQALGGEEVASRLLRAGGTRVLLVDTGHRPTHLISLEHLSRLAQASVHEIVRIESVFEQLASEHLGRSDDRCLEAFASTLEARALHAVGLKSIASYRVTFAVEWSRPAIDDVRVAFARWRDRCRASGKLRLDDPTLIRHALWVGAEWCRKRKLPLQLHVGFGDPDIVMHACDPSHATELLRVLEEWEVPAMLLHNYPFVREAAWLSEIFQNVYYDVGVILNYSGPSAQRIMDEAMELGPFTKHLYSSDAFGLPELHYLGAMQYRRTLEQVLSRWVGAGECSTRDAERIAACISADNATRAYRLSERV